MAEVHSFRLPTTSCQLLEDPVAHGDSKVGRLWHLVARHRRNAQHCGLPDALAFQRRNIVDQAPVLPQRQDHIVECRKVLEQQCKRSKIREASLFREQQANVVALGSRSRIFEQLQDGSGGVPVFDIIEEVRIDLRGPNHLERVDADRAGYLDIAHQDRCPHLTDRFVCGCDFEVLQSPIQLSPLMSTLDLVSENSRR